MPKIPALFLTLMLAVPTLCFAQNNGLNSLPQVPAHLASQDPNACWSGAAQYHGVDLWLLYSIALVESNMNPKVIGRNKNGSLDLGMMQINTIWLNDLARYGINSTQLMDGCTSVYVGAWILAKNFRTYGNTWRAIGAYNSGTPAIGYNYAKKVYATHHKLTGVPTTYFNQSNNQAILSKISK